MCYLLFTHKNDKTPLIISVYTDNLEMFKFLIDNGALTSINTPGNVCKYLITSNHMLIYACIYVYIIVH